MQRTMKTKIASISRISHLFLLSCAVFLLVMGIGNTFAYVMTKTPTLVNNFLNGMNANGDLVIQKIVSHPYGDSYTIPSDLAFTFEVDLGTEYASQTVKTTQGEQIADENGIVTVTVAPGGRTTIYGVDEETIVTVTETLIAAGFTPDAESKSLTIQKHQDNILTFTNTYIPMHADTSALEVSGRKTLEGREWIEDDHFTFALEVRENGTWRSLGTQTIVYELVEQVDPSDPEKTIMVPKTDFDQFDFTELIRSYNFVAAGSYSFRVSEIEGSIGGVTYDKAESKFEVLVEDVDMDGYLEIHSITTTSANTVVDGTTVSIGFKNRYAPTGSTEAIIEIQKNMEDTSGQNKSPVGYTFDLYDSEGNVILTSDSTGTTGETSVRLVYEPADAGKTFEYVLKESRCGETVGALTYDNTEYPLKVTVVDNLDGTVSAYIYDSDTIEESADSDRTDSDGGTLTTQVSVPDGITNSCQKTFTNRYDPVDAAVVIHGKKTLSGRTMNPEEFSFQLYQTDASYTNTEGAQPIRTAVNGPDKTFSFDALSFDKAGTNYYVVKEDASAALGGVAYDESVYLVKVIVTDTDGVLNAVVSVTDAYGQISEILFQNSYKAAPAYLPLSGKKTINGLAPKDAAFRFLLFRTDPFYHVQGEYIQCAENNAAGEFSFEALELREAGIYHYVVMEETGTVEGMTYDSSKYCIAVTVTDPGDGRLVISEFSITKDGNDVSEIVFDNTKEEEPDIPDIPDIPDKPDNPDKPVVPDNPVIPDQPTQPDEPTVPEQPDQPMQPETGDNSNVMPYSIMMIISGCILLLILMAESRERKK